VTKFKSQFVEFDKSYCCVFVLHQPVDHKWQIESCYLSVLTEMAAASSIKPAWKSVKPMPTKRVYSSPVMCGGQLYVVGGCDSSGIPLDCFESYHPGRDRWYRLANVPTKRASPCVLSVGGKLVALGGVSTTQQPLNVVEVYDATEKEWTQQDVMKDHLMGMSGVVRGIVFTFCSIYSSLNLGNGKSWDF